MSDLYLSAEQTAKRLGIGLTSVYAYVSRGLIRSQKVPGTKRRLYWKADVERLRRGDNVPADALPERLVERTSITLLTPAGHYYRGVSALQLARTETLESVAALLWQVDQAAVFRDELPRLPKSAAGPQRRDDTVWQRTMRMLFAIERSDPRAYNLSREGYCRSGVDVLRCAFSAALNLPALSTAPAHDLVCDTLGADDRLRDVLRAYLVLAADHELDPTTYAVRAAANTGVTPYAAVAAGLITSSGRRLVFGRAASVARFFEEMDAADDPREPVLQRVRAGETVPGFATSPYPHGDPRAAMMLDLLREAWGDTPAFERLETTIATIADATGAVPGFVIPALFLERALGMRNDQTTLLRLARIVGWIAHAVEQFYDSDLVRPHADYAGILPTPEP